jgi:hypothetical protein
MFVLAPAVQPCKENATASDFSARVLSRKVGWVFGGQKEFWMGSRETVGSAEEKERLTMSERSCGNYATL